MKGMLDLYIEELLYLEDEIITTPHINCIDSEIVIITRKYSLKIFKFKLFYIVQYLKGCKLKGIDNIYYKDIIKSLMRRDKYNIKYGENNQTSN